jgi:hypothetical protein
MYQVTHTRDGKVETFRSTRALEEVVSISPRNWELLRAGKTIDVETFLGTIQVRKIAKKS